MVELDPTEQGDRALLNFGHTLVHAIEKLMNFQLYHGECVVLGMIAALNISATRGHITQAEYDDAIQTVSYTHLDTAPAFFIRNTKKQKC